MSDLLITIHGERGSGKTTLLELLLDAIADNGLMTVADTRLYTEHSGAYWRANRIANTDTVEQIDITICHDSLVNYRKAMREPLPKGDA